MVRFHSFFFFFNRSGEQLHDVFKPLAKNHPVSLDQKGARTPSPTVPPPISSHSAPAQAPVFSSSENSAPDVKSYFLLYSHSMHFPHHFRVSSWFILPTMQKENPSVIDKPTPRHLVNLQQKNTSIQKSNSSRLLTNTFYPCRKVMWWL